MHKNDNCCTKEVIIPKCCNSVFEELCLPMTDTGKVLVINLTLKQVLANKVISIGLFVFEGKVLKGFKVRSINTGDYNECDDKEDLECPNYSRYKSECKCKDVRTGNFYFVFPDEDQCDNKKISIKIVTHYSDINIC